MIARSVKALALLRRSVGSRQLIILFCGWLQTAVSAPVSPTEAARLQLSILTNNRAARLTLTGPAQTYHRIDSSTNLAAWQPLGLFYNASGSAQLTDPMPAVLPAQFYRAQQVEASTAILGLSRASGLPGTRVEIGGQFFLENKTQEAIVTFGGVEAKVVAATDTQLVVEVPENARTGPITVTTPQGTASSHERFVVTGLARVSVSAPPGLSASDFVVLNTYGSANRTGLQQADAPLLIPVRAHLPMITVAVPTDSVRLGSLMAVSLSAEAHIVLDATSTAEAMVFATSFFSTLNPTLAQRFLGLIRRDPKVAELAVAITDVFAQNNDPFATPRVVEALEAAVGSVATALNTVTPPSRPPARAGLHRTPEPMPTLHSVYELDLDFLRITGSDRERKIESFQFMNPVDWNAIVYEIDVDEAFPNGRPDFEAAFLRKQTLVDYPSSTAKDRIDTIRLVPADTLSATFNPFLYIAGEAGKAIFGSSPNQNPVGFPDRSGLYLMRGVGPRIAFGSDSESAKERDFAWRTPGLRQVYENAIAVNVTAAVMDTISLFIDLKLLPLEGIVKKVMLESFKRLPTIRGLGDALGAVVEIVQFTLLELGETLGEEQMEKLVKYVARLGGNAARLVPIYQIFDRISSAGQVLERLAGMFGFLIFVRNTTPLETAFIVVGDPFTFDIMRLEPQAVAPGEDISLVLDNVVFDPANRNHKVLFRASRMFELEQFEFEGENPRVESLGEEVQRVTVRIPKFLGTIEFTESEYPVFVLAEGRRGEATYQLLRKPAITQLFPRAGFQAGGSFLGESFEGSAVTILGKGFSGRDLITFTGGARVTRVLSDEGGGIGRLTFLVPRGAQSGPIILRHEISANAFREGKTLPFFVLGPPVIESMTPEKGPPGTMVLLKVNNVDDGSYTRARFAGTPLLELNSVQANEIKVLVPTNAQTGPLTILTPAGSDQRTFTVETGRAPGSTIIVGPLLSLARALDIASGAVIPFDDRDVDPVENRQLDPPFEEGDAITPDLGPAANPRFQVGELFSDKLQLAGELPGEATISGEFDILDGRTFAATIKGTLIVEGNSNHIRLTVRGSPSHGIVVRGERNFLDVICEGNGGDGLRIEGGKNNEIFVRASQNRGNGVSLVGEARGNVLFVQTGVRDSRGNAMPNSGNVGHGVLISDGAAGNTISIRAGSAIAANGGDGIHLDGAEAHNNSIFANAVGNAGHGVVVVGPVRGTYIRSTSDANGRSGIALIGGPGGSPVATVVEGRANRNVEYGLLLSGVVDTNDTTELSLNGSGNLMAGVRLENGSAGLRLPGLVLSEDGVGLELAGADVRDNTINASISTARQHGVSLTSAADNQFYLFVVACGGNGLLLNGGQGNIVAGTLADNKGDGIRLTGAALNNRIEGVETPRNQNGVAIEGGARGNVLYDLVSNGNREHGVLIQGADTRDNRLSRSRLGVPRGGEQAGNGGDGVRVQDGASANFIGSDLETPVELRNNRGAGIRITGAGTRGNVIAGCRIALGLEREQPAGVVVEASAEGTAIGSVAPVGRNEILQNQEGVIIRGARDASILNSVISTNTDRGILVENSAGVLVGSNLGRGGNELIGNHVGIELSGTGAAGCRVQANTVRGNSEGLTLSNGASDNIIGQDNSILENEVGLRLTGAQRNRVAANVIRDNTLAGVLLDEGATANLVLDCTIAGNGTGVEVRGASSLRNAIRQNSITASRGKGILLSGGGNAGILPPAGLSYDGQTIRGTSSAPEGSLIELFKDPQDEGETFVAAGIVLDNHFEAAALLPLAQAATLFRLNATATDSSGNTSEFSAISGGGSGTPASRLVFSSTRDGNAEIYLLDALFSSPARLTTHPAEEHSPAISSGGTEVVFVSTRDGNPELYVALAKPEAIARRLTDHASPDYDPAWSPDEKVLAFVSERDGNPEIYVVNKDGSNVKRITSNESVERSPVFSPDGKKFAFASNRAGNFDLWVMNTDGTDPKPLVSDLADDLQPAWAPDGQSLAFVSHRDGNLELYLVRADGTGLARLTNDTSDDVEPAWLADGSALVFSSNRTDGFELFVRRLGEGIDQRLTVSLGNNSRPSASTR